MMSLNKKQVTEMIENPINSNTATMVMIKMLLEEILVELKKQEAPAELAMAQEETIIEALQEELPVEVKVKKTRKKKTE